MQGAIKNTRERPTIKRLLPLSFAANINQEEKLFNAEQLSLVK